MHTIPILTDTLGNGAQLSKNECKGKNWKKRTHPKGIHGTPKRAGNKKEVVQHNDYMNIAPASK